MPIKKPLPRPTPRRDFVIHQHREGGIELVFTPEGTTKTVAMHLSSVEKDIWNVLMSRIYDRLDPALAPRTVPPKSSKLN